MPDLRIARSVAELRDVLNAWRRDGHQVGLVPTMGALHDGHFSLVDRSLRETDRTCVSLFVNPKQFGPNEDFDVYPRDEAGDAHALAARGVQLLFAPSVEEMYPAGAQTTVSVAGIGDVLEGEHRPGFFTGVATIVSKLLIQASPDAAYFGEKDYQQLCVIQRMTADLNIPTKIVGCAIVREADGLALSSRNAYLSDDERQIAPKLNDVIQTVARGTAAGDDVDQLTSEATRQLLDEGFASVDYIAVRDAVTLEPVDGPGAAARVLAAAWLGKTRLIDNVAVD